MCLKMKGTLSFIQVQNNGVCLSILNGRTYEYLHSLSLLKMLSCVPKNRLIQRAKKVVSDSMGLLDFAIGLVNSVFNLPDGQVMFFEEFE